MAHRLLFVIALLVLLMVLPAAWVVPHSLAAGPDAVLDRLRHEADSVSTIRSDFIQERHLSIFKDTLISKGWFAFSRPGNLRWEYLEPVRSGFTVCNTHGTRWNALSHETNEFDVRSDPIMHLVSEQLLAWTRFDVDWLRKRYTFEVQNESPIQLKLTPAQAGEMEGVDSLRLVFSDDARTIRMVEVRDKDGDFTRILFQRAVTNSDLPPDTFQAP